LPDYEARRVVPSLEDVFIAKVAQAEAADAPRPTA
jgi:hypothetical protein